jgi:hypothetical protein
MKGRNMTGAEQELVRRVTRGVVEAVMTLRRVQDYAGLRRSPPSWVPADQGTEYSKGYHKIQQLCENGMRSITLVLPEVVVSLEAAAAEVVEEGGSGKG